MLGCNDLMKFWFSASLRSNEAHKKRDTKKSMHAKDTKTNTMQFHRRSFMELMTYHINHRAERIKAVNDFGKSSAALGHANRSLFTRAKRKKLLRHNRDLNDVEASY